MLNILIPLAGKSIFFEGPEFQFPKPLIEIKGNTIIQLAIENLSMIEEDKHFIFIVNSEDCEKFHLDSVLKLLTDGNCDIIKITNETKGAACSSLLAIEHIDNEDILIIANYDQFFQFDINLVIKNFYNRKLDAGVITFETIHPRWSYVRIDDNENVIEAAEKRPISKNAIAGFYYFKRGSDFVRAAKQSIYKDSNVNGIYYVAPVLNELILENKKIGMYKICNENYNTFYSPQKIKEFEQNFKKQEIDENI